MNQYFFRTQKFLKIKLLFLLFLFPDIVNALNCYAHFRQRTEITKGARLRNIYKKHCVCTCTHRHTHTHKTTVRLSSSSFFLFVQICFVCPEFFSVSMCVFIVLNSFKLEKITIFEETIIAVFNIHKEVDLRFWILWFTLFWCKQNTSHWSIHHTTCASSSTTNKS